MKKLIFCLVFLQLGISHLVNAQENIALNKPATQSSTGWNGKASYAVDGNTNGYWSWYDLTITHTYSQSNPWWKIDLGAKYDISKINIFNRKDCCWNRLNGAKVYVGNINSNNPSDYIEVGTLTSNKEVQTFENLTEKIGRYVMIHIAGNNKILSLAEVQVYGEEYTEPEEPEKENIALNKPATQSSTSWNGKASNAVDGNTNGYWKWHDLTITHTNTQSNPWWKIDLGAKYDISKINIFNRKDCCWNRLNGAKVYVSNINSNDPSDYIEVGTLTSNKEVQTFENLTEKIGRYVMIHIAGNNKILSLAEVQIYGEEYTEPEEPEKENIALNKPATQSSDYTYCWNESGCQASNANDESSTTASGTNYENEAWWRVDLEDNYNVSKLEIKFESDFIYGGANVYVGYTKIGEIKSDGFKVFDNLSNISGEFVLIKTKYEAFLQLYDVKVYGTKVDEEGSEQSRFALQTQNIPGTIQAEYYDNGGEGIAYHDDNNKHGDANFRPNDKVDVKTYHNNSRAIGWTKDGEWVEYTLNVSESGYYNIILSASSNVSTPGSVEFSIDHEAIGTFNIKNTGHWAAYNKFRVSDIFLEEGDNRVLRLKIDGGGLNINYFRFDKVNQENNLAFNKPTSQSSSDYGYDSSVSGTVARSGSNAVDGSNSTYSKTTQHLRPWWLLDLKQPCDINKIQIIGSTYYLKDAKVYVGNKASNDPSDFTLLSFLYSKSGYYEIPSDVRGQYILILHDNDSKNLALKLDEVEVFGEYIETDLALNRKTRQRSTASSHPSSLAIDNDANTYSLTGNSDNNISWWYVDLGDYYDLSKVEIDLLDFPSNPEIKTFLLVGDGVYARADDFQYRMHVTSKTQNFNSILVDNNVKGRYVMIARTHPGNNVSIGIKNISVYGKPSKLRHLYRHNVALGKKIEMSSTLLPGVASNANDDNLESSWNGGVLAHTNTRDFYDPGPTAFPMKREYPWIKIDLGEQYKLNEIKIYNRSYWDCCHNRLEKFDLFVGNVDCIDENRYDKISDGGLSSDYSQSFDIDKIARYVMLKSTDDNAILNIAELLVFGDRIGSSNNMRVYDDGEAINFKILEENGEHANLESNINVYPNPNNGKFHINYTALSEGETNLQIMDVTGRVIKTTAHYCTEKGQIIKDFIELDKSVRKGLYLINISHSNGLNETVRIQKK